MISRAREAVARALMPYAPADNSFLPPPTWPVSFWQQGYRAPLQGGNAAVESCVGAISQTIASLPLQHWRTLRNGGRKLIEDSPAARVLRKPNPYQTRADFILNILRAELLTGNGLAVATRERGEIVRLSPLPARMGAPYVTVDGDIYYSIGGTDDALLPEPSIENYFPARDVLHLRMNTPRHPLIGESPITAAAMSVQAGNAISGHMSAFFSNMTRPSGYLTSPKPLKQDAGEKLREMWQQSYSGADSGKIAALFDGVEWKPMSITSVDAQLIESYKLTVADVARVYRVPLAVIGELGGATYSNAETLLRHWLSTGLGFVVEHVELALDDLFGIPPDEYIGFDIDYLLRADFPARIDGLVKGITGGLFAPNEAREREGLPAVEFGDEPRLQAQVVPLSAAKAVPAAPSAPAAEVAPPAPPAKALPSSDAVVRLLEELGRAPRH